MSFWSSLKDTVESIGGAVAAPYGVVFDLAQAPFDDKDDNFGTIAAKVAGRAGDLADPFFNEDTWSGAAFSKTMKGLEHIYREEISEPTAAAFTQVGSFLDSGDVGVFGEQGWAKAYEVAQNRSMGQSAVLMGLAAGPQDLLDPMDKRAWKQINQAAPISTNLASGTIDFLARWYLDPGIIVGKGAAGAKQALGTRKITAEDRINLADKMANAEAKRLGVPTFVHNRKDIATRTDQYLEWTDGKEASAIFHGSPELRRSGEGKTIAGLLADANRLEDDVLRRDAKRRILAVAAGDDTQIRRLQEEIADAPSIVDALKNMRRGTTLELKTQALVPSARHNPVFIADLERQLDNLNTDDTISNLVKGHEKRLQSMLAVNNSLTELPGVSARGNRAARKEAGETGKLTQLGREVDQWAKDWADAPNAQTAFQKSVHHVPLVVVRTAGLAASPWTKAPGKIVGSLKQAHFQGVVNLHDWNGASTQLDSMMRLAGVDDGARMKTLSEVYLAKTEPEKMRLIDRIEQQSIKSLWARYGERVDNPDGLEAGAFIEELMRRGSVTRAQQLSQLRGRTYAATAMPPDMLATRGKGMMAAQDQAAKAGVEGTWKPRVDMVDDHGTPLALPLLETQLANSVPLLDIDLAKKLIKRDASYMQRLARAWKQENLEIGRLSSLKARGGKNLDKALQARRAAADYLVDMGQRSMRLWKFGVLFRLGYPIRVVMDDHMRIWTQLNAMTFYGSNGREAAGNLWYNQVGRRRQAAEFMHAARVERRELLDRLEALTPEAYAARKADITRTMRSINGKRNALARWIDELEESEGRRSLGLDPTVDAAAYRKKIKETEDLIREKEGALEYLREQLGDDPDDLKRALVGIEDRLAQGAKAFRPEKRNIGEKDIVLPGGYTASGAYAGPYGKAWLESTKSGPTFAAQLEGAEDRVRRSVMTGSYRTIQPHEAGHLDAWADVVNNQFAMSKVARHFLSGKSVDDFAERLRTDPAWADLRERLAHYAHDPEDWGQRVQALIRDYLPTDALRQKALDGKVRARDLARAIQDPSVRPAVHGNIVAFNLGDISHQAQLAGKTMNRIYRFLGEMPTDRLSRHPYFNSMYKQHIIELHTEALAAAKRQGLKYGPDDIKRLETVARKRALNDLKRTLFDISAHSHAAHLMRFVSPFFAAHQEALTRWWRIVSDDPSVVRKFQLAFDMPRKVGLVYDSQTGEPVKPGDAISSEHRIMLRVPESLKGTWLGAAVDGWSVNENSFNLVLQGGIMNPGAGPLVTVPVEAVTKRYANEEEIARVARVLNPYPPDSPLDPLIPATAQRTIALFRKEGDPEYARRYSQNAMDLMVKFEEAHGRPPNKNEAEAIMVRAGRQTNVDALLRVFWNALSPAPARPESKYAAIQMGWYKISEQARAEGRDFEWARDRFVEKYDDIYLPLIYSSSNNPANVSMSTESVAQVKRHRGLLRKIDPALTRMVLGAEGEGDYSPEARAWFKSARMNPGDTATYLSDDSPKEMLVEQVVRQGWSKYSALTGALTAAAQEQGLASYRDSEQLDAIRKAAVEKLKQDNPLWWNDFNDFNVTDYDQYVEDMREIATAPALVRDTERQDIQVLRGYLELRDMVVGELARRKAAGLPYTRDAAANQPLLSMYSKLVGALVEKSPDFENYFYNGTIERDPLLVGD